MAAEITRRIFTIGHSRHPWEAFLEMLQAAGITALVDVRSFPRSRFAPWANRARLETASSEAGISYHFFGDALGGRPEGEHLYDAAGNLDYERVRQEKFYRDGIVRLAEVVAGQEAVCLMCSEEDPARCHRTLLLAPQLIERGLEVVHLRAGKK